MANSANDGALQGASDLIAKLTAMGSMDDNKVMKGAVKAGMKPTLAVAQTRIPVGTRFHKTYKGRKVAPGFGKSQLKIVVTSKRDDGNVAAMLGVSQEAFYETQFLERGTSKMRAHPWLRASFFDTKDQQERAMVVYLQACYDKLAKTGKF